MAGDPSKDVLLNMRLVAAPGNRQVAADVAKAGVGAYAQIEAASKRAAGVQNKEAAGVARNHERALQRSAREAERAAQKEAREAERAAAAKQKADDRVFRNRAKLLAQAAREEQKVESQRTRAAQQASAAYEAASEKQFSLSKNIAENSAKATRGVLDIAQGLAVLGIAGEEDLKKFVMAWAKIEAGFKVAKGGLDVVLGLTEAMRAYRASTLAAAAAQEALAVAQGISSVAGAKGGKAAGGAGGAVGTLATGVTLAGGAKGLIGGGAAAGGGTAAGGVTAAGVASAAVIAVAAVEAAQALARSLGLKNEWTKSRTGQLGAAIGNRAGEWWAGDGGNDKREAALQRQREFIAQQVERQNNQAGFAASVIAAQRENAEGLGADALKRFNLGELSAARAGVKAADASTEEFGAVREAQQLNSLERLKAAQEAIAEQDQKRVESLKQAADQQAQQVKQAQDQLKTARELVKTERERFDSTKAKFGRLDAASQNELARIAGKVKSGQQIGEGDARLLDKIGFGSKVSDKFFANKAGAAGEDVLNILGEGDSLKDAQGKAVQSAAALAKAEGEHTATMQLLNRESAKLGDTFRELNNVLNRIFQLRSEQSGLTVPQTGSTGDGQASTGGGRFQQVALDAAGVIGESTEGMIKAFDTFTNEVVKHNQEVVRRIDREGALRQLHQA